MMRREMLARRGDIHTSHEAAAKVDTFKAGHEALVFAAICGSVDGLTYRAIATLAKLEPVAVGRRLVAMERRRLITRRRDELTGEYKAQDNMALWYRK